MADKIKKLSDAIRLGATFHPQCIRTFCRKDGDKVTHTCALGAAMDAVGLLKELKGTESVSARFPKVPRRIFSQVIWYSDHPKYEWSREAIADWVAAQGY